MPDPEGAAVVIIGRPVSHRHGLAECQIEAERRSHPLMLALRGAEAEHQIVELTLGCDAGLDGTFGRRGDGTRVKLEPYLRVQGREIAVHVDDLEPRLAPVP